MLDPRLPKLPVWAQELITRLEREVATGQRRIKELTSGAAGSSITFGQYGEERPVDPHGRLRIQLGPSHDDWVEVSQRKDEVYIMGGRSILIRPNVSNVLTVAIDPQR